MALSTLLSPVIVATHKLPADSVAVASDRKDWQECWHKAFCYTNKELYIYTYQVGQYW